VKIETTKPKCYKSCFIVGVVIEAPRLYGWRAQGIIYALSGQELKRVNYLRHSVFTYKKYAKDAGLRMCRYWIDNRQTELKRLRKRQRNAAMAKPKRAARFHRSHKR
jgi:hypothetical protein